MRDGSYHRVIPPRRAKYGVLALLGATAISCGILVARWIYAEKIVWLGFMGNLVLAWLPLIFAGATYLMYSRRSPRWWLLAGCAVAWFFFFPNAPYIVTDLVHLKTKPPIPRWYDLILIMSFAWTGLFLGFLSLYLMQEIVRHWLGRAAGWWFALSMLALSSFGIYLGRFLRSNSWHVLTRPFGLAKDIALLANPMTNAQSAAFCATFFAFSLIFYISLYTMTHLHGWVDREEG